MADRRVLYVVHNHPQVRAGGAEVYALDLYESLRDHGSWEPLLLARTGPPVARFGRPHLGTALAGVDGDPAQTFLFTDQQDYDWLNGTLRSKQVYIDSLRRYLLTFRPDVVHFQHSLLIGFEALREVRNTLPDAAIVYTLHEFVPICHNHGQMVRTFDGSRCETASPRRCHECFPDILVEDFALRERFIKAHLQLVDLFVAPSRFLRERYIAWGIPESRIVYEENGTSAIGGEPEQDVARPRTRLGFFGQFTPFKGADVLLEAVRLLVDQGVDVHVSLHGSMEHQPSAYCERVERLAEAAGAAATLAGPYRRDELASLMAAVDWVVVPSTWWENSPLVIQEAFLHGRPVICSDIGGMAEKVQDGVNGIHFRAGDATALAQELQRALGDERLWRQLRAALPGPRRMSDHIERLTGLYEDVLAARPTMVTT